MALSSWPVSPLASDWLLWRQKAVHSTGHPPCGSGWSSAGPRGGPPTPTRGSTDSDAVTRSPGGVAREVSAAAVLQQDQKPRRLLAPPQHKAGPPDRKGTLSALMTRLWPASAGRMWATARKGTGYIPSSQTASCLRLCCSWRTERCSRALATGPRAGQVPAHSSRSRGTPSLSLAGTFPGDTNRRAS